VFQTTAAGLKYIPVATRVPYILGIPSVRAEVLGLVGENYVLRQEYDFLNEEGKLEHVKKDYYRDKKFIEGYWLDTFRSASHCHEAKGI
jgi:hypothetical protein